MRAPGVGISLHVHTYDCIACGDVCIDVGEEIARTSDDDADDEDDYVEEGSRVKLVLAGVYNGRMKGRGMALCAVSLRMRVRYVMAIRM